MPNLTRFGRPILCVVVAMMLLPLLFSTTAHPAAAWTDSNWTRRHPITITAGNNGMPENYQIRITVPYDADMQADYEDLRFYLTDDVTELSFWIENYTGAVEGTDNAYVWVRLPFSLAASANQDINMYYGNASTESAENGEATFEFFDDFTDNSKWNNWNASGYEIENSDYLRFIAQDGTSYIIYAADSTWQYGAVDYRLKNHAVSAESHLYLHAHAAADTSNDSATGDRIQIKRYTASDSIESVDEIWDLYTHSQVTDVYQTFTLGWTGGNQLHSYLDYAHKAENTHTPSSGVLKFVNWYTKTDWYMDWIRIRKFTYPEPTASLGAEETTASWHLIETWTGTVSASIAPAQWRLIETWTGTVNAPASWNLIETWAGTVQTTGYVWNLIETWTAIVKAPAEWSLIETWSGRVNDPTQWNLIETWTGTVTASAQWSLIESWTGLVQAPAAWQLIENWIGTVEASVPPILAWQLIETWTGTVVTTNNPDSSDGIPPPGAPDWTPPPKQDDWVAPGQREDWTPPGKQEDWIPPGQRDDWVPPGKREDWVPPGKR